MTATVFHAGTPLTPPILDHAGPVLVVVLDHAGAPLPTPILEHAA